MYDETTLAAIITGGILLGLLILVGLPVVLSIRMGARHRELEHEERMKALELGRPFPGDPLPNDESQAVSPMDKGVRIGILVPLGALGIAFVATTTLSNGTTSMVPMAIWISSAAVGVAGVICGTVLAMRAPAAPTVPSRARGASLKPAPFEEDALDLVGRRG
jgi:hypothetical protein